MAVESSQLESIVTHPAGTILQYGNAYFFDANQNGRLDVSDKKVIGTVTEEEYRFDFYLSRVSEQDVKVFGRKAEQDFAQAKKERENLSRTLPPQKSGQCLFNMKGGDQWVGMEVPFRFRPPLSAHTSRLDEKKIYNFIELLGMNKSRPTVDPGRCPLARGVFFQEGVAGLPLEPREIEINTGNRMFHPALAAFGLKNGNEADVAYSILNGAERMHIDLVR